MTERHALLIGINRYPQLAATSQLRGCVNDILDMRSFLVDHADFPATNVRLLLSELPDRKLPDGLGRVEDPTATMVRQALTALSEGIQPGDEVVIYYSGHGIRIRNPQNDNEQIGAIAAMDVRFENGVLAPETLVINREMNTAMQSLLAAGATVTAVLDACHSGGATRDLDDRTNLTREILGEISPEGWQALVSQHGLNGADLTGGDKRSIDSGGWATSLADQANLIVLSGCRDIETSKEFPRDTRRNGALSYFLIDTLRKVKGDQAGQMTWQDLYPHIRQAVVGAYPDQTPTLEGHVERPLFGGAWRPYDPGFTVTVTAGSPALHLNGGTVHGLGEGAQVAIYPPGTSDFVAAEKQGVQPTVAQVDAADLVTSRAHVIKGSPTVADGSRARLIKPADKAARLGVLLTDVPAEVATALAQAPGVSDFVVLNPTKARPDFEIRPNPTGPGWVLVPYRSTTEAPTPNDVIAQTPGLDADDAATLGTALGLGLVHWARYWAVLTRRNTDTTLGTVLSLTLLAGDDADAMAHNPNDPQVARPVTPNAAGVCEVGPSSNLMLKVAITSTAPTRLFVGILACSNDGNILRFWPPENADNRFDPGQEKILGFGASLRPFTLRVDRPEQTASLYTFKAFATNAADAVDLGSLEQERTVQEVIDAALPSRRDVMRGGFGRGGFDQVGAQAPRVLWTTVELPVRVKRPS